MFYDKFNLIHFNSIQFTSIQYNPIQSNQIQFNSIQFNSIQFNSIQFNSIQFNSTQSYCNIIIYYADSVIQLFFYIIKRSDHKRKGRRISMVWVERIEGWRHALCILQYWIAFQYVALYWRVWQCNLLCCTVSHLNMLHRTFCTVLSSSVVY